MNNTEMKIGAVDNPTKIKIHSGGGRGNMVAPRERNGIKKVTSDIKSKSLMTISQKQSTFVDYRCNAHMEL